MSFALQTCPLLLRVFTTNNGRHHRMDEFARGNVPSSELQIYTWWVAASCRSASQSFALGIMDIDICIVTENRAAIVFFPLMDDTVGFW